MLKNNLYKVWQLLLTLKKDLLPVILLLHRQFSTPKFLMLELASLKTGFLPVFAQLLKDNVCKLYLDFLFNIKNDQKLSNIFCHNDHDVFFKLSRAIWRKKWKHRKYNGRFPFFCWWHWKFFIKNSVWRVKRNGG